MNELLELNEWLDGWMDEWMVMYQKIDQSMNRWMDIIITNDHTHIPIHNSRRRIEICPEFPSSFNQQRRCSTSFNAIHDRGNNLLVDEEQFE